MANVNVTYTDMDSAAKQLGNGQVEIENMLNSLKKLVDGLVNGGYVTDKSSKQFEQSYAQFNQGITQTVQGLEGMSKYLSSAAQAFSQIDEQLAQQLSKG